MRLGTLATGDGTTAAVFVDGMCATVPGFADAGAVVRAGAGGSAQAQAALATGLDAYDRANLKMPVLEPGAVVCQGMNFKKHILEMGRDLPATPTLFGKLARALCGPADTVPLSRYRTLSTTRESWSW